MSVLVVGWMGVFDRVVNANPERERVAQRLVADRAEEWFELVPLHVDKLTLLHHTTNAVQSREGRLLKVSAGGQEGSQRAVHAHPQSSRRSGRAR